MIETLSGFLGLAICLGLVLLVSARYIDPETGAINVIKCVFNGDVFPAIGNGNNQFYFVVDIV